MDVNKTDSGDDGPALALVPSLTTFLSPLSSNPGEERIKEKGREEKQMGGR